MAEASIQHEFYESVILQITEGDQKGKRFELVPGRNIIGRSPDSQVHLEDAVISRQHVCITVAQDIEVEDMGSSQGTVLNGRMLLGRDFLFDNDELRVGPFTLTLELKRRESRKGIMIGLACLGVAALVLLAGLMMRKSGMAQRIANENIDAAEEVVDPMQDWHNWEILVLPSVKQLEKDGIRLDPRVAKAQFDLATRLYEDRLGDMGNPYRSLIHYKRALAIATALPPEQRPAITSRGLNRIGELEKIIKSGCESRVFSYKKLFELQDWGEVTRVLTEIQQISPWSSCRFGLWSSAQLEALDRMLQ